MCSKKRAVSSEKKVAQASVGAYDAVNYSGARTWFVPEPFTEPSLKKTRIFEFSSEKKVKSKKSSDPTDSFVETERYFVLSSNAWMQGGEPSRKSAASHFYEYQIRTLAEIVLCESIRAAFIVIR